MDIDLTTKFMGLSLANPVVVAACPLTGELDVLRKLADRGAAAAVLPSLFEEQLEHPSAPLMIGEGTMLDDVAHFHALKEYNRGPDAYLRHISAAKRAVQFPIIGSLNVTGRGEAPSYAKRMQEAGADAIEMNMYFVVTDPDITSVEVEARYVELVAAVRAKVSIPLAVKISPYITSLTNFCRRLVDAGADGLTLFNRFLQPDIDLNTMRAVPRLALSTSDELRQPLRWIGLLHGRVHASLAGTTGVHCPDDAIKMILAGADVVMIASTLYRHGIDVLPTLIGGISTWLEGNDYKSIQQIKGCLSQRRCPCPGVFERANYTRALASFVDQSKTA